MFNLANNFKIHNRFDFYVEDVKTGENRHAAIAENAVLKNMFKYLVTEAGASASSPFGARVIYGTGTGTIDNERTELFDRLGFAPREVVELDLKIPPLVSNHTIKGVIPAGTHTGETLTEVGLSYGASGTEIVTHALLKDSENNPISIGPLAETEQVTIFATVFLEFNVVSDGALPLVHPVHGNKLMKVLLGFDRVLDIRDVRNRLYVSSDKTVTNQELQYNSGIGFKSAPLILGVEELRKNETGRVRFDTPDGNGKIWSMSWVYVPVQAANTEPVFRMTFPNDIYQGYQFVNKFIAVGDGVTATFNLPWSDINMAKTKKFYVDGVEASALVTNSEALTTVEFDVAPGDGLQITGDWWVDYIPKDTEHILDVFISTTYNEG